MVAASKFAQTAVESAAAPKRNQAVTWHIARFRALQKTQDVPERLELLGHATRGADGALVLRKDVRKQLDDLEARLRTSLAAGASYREAAEAAKLDVDVDEVTFVVYALFRKDGGVELYIGETGRTPAERFAEHPQKCQELAAAFAETGGKDAWTCAVLLVLPEDARSKELLLYIEERIQRLLDTVDGAHGRNCHYGAGVYGGAADEVSWLARYIELIEFVAKRGKSPSVGSKNIVEKTLGKWASTQRQRREKMSTHRREALEALGCAWRWRIKATRMTNASLFEKLRAEDRVTSSGGVDIPAVIDGVGLRRVEVARRQFKTEVMPEFDRAIVLMEFPGIAMTSQDVSFYLSAQAFAAAHPGAKTLPSHAKEPMLYDWLDHIRRCHIDTNSAWREKVLGDLGLSALLKTLKPHEVRAATFARNKARNANFTADRSGTRAKAREAEKRGKIDAVSGGPNNVY